MSIFNGSFEAELEITLNRKGLLELLEKAGYSFPVTNETCITVRSVDKRNNIVFHSDDGKLEIKLCNEKP